MVALQALSGTGSLRVGAAFIAKFLPGTKVLLSNPTWGNHNNIFADAGVPAEKYRCCGQCPHLIVLPTGEALGLQHLSVISSESGWFSGRMGRLIVVSMHMICHLHAPMRGHYRVVLAAVRFVHACFVQAPHSLFCMKVLRPRDGWSGLCGHAGGHRGGPQRLHHPPARQAPLCSAMLKRSPGAHPQHLITAATAVAAAHMHRASATCLKTVAQQIAAQLERYF